MGYLVRARWQRAIEGSGLPRREYAAGDYDAYVPDPLAGRAFPLTGEVAADVADATLAVASLDARAAALTNTEALARLLLRAEAVASSRIEGLVISPQRLLRADIARHEALESHDDAALAVLANVDAMALAIAGGREAITLEQIVDVHRRLLADVHEGRYAGVIRTEQNWIGGNAYNPIGADYVPPPPEQLPGLLDDLVAFCNENRLPAIVQAAIAHAQFESIHPFADGNGRVGRALIYMVLRRRGLALRATPPISLVLATRSREYVAALTGTRAVGAPDDEAAQLGADEWIGFFAAATVRAVADAEAFEARVAEIQSRWRERLADLRSDAAAFRLVAALPAAPIVTAGSAATLIDRSFRAGNDAIEILVERGILTPSTAGKRNRVFEARELIDAFTGLERNLGSSIGDTVVAPPARPVPARPRRR